MLNNILHPMPKVNLFAPMSFIGWPEIVEKLRADEAAEAKQTALAMPFALLETAISRKVRKMAADRRYRMKRHSMSMAA